VATIACSSALARTALPHHAAVVRLLAAATALEIEPPRERAPSSLRSLPDEGPTLVFLCGLPYVRLRDAGVAIDVLAAPVPQDARCRDAPVYFSDLVVRPSAPALGRVLVRNDLDSLSGWVLPLAAGLDPGSYSRVLTSGGHRRSLEMLVAGDADATPVDSMVLAAERDRDAAVRALSVETSYGPAPSPPVALAGGDAATAVRLRHALAALQGSAEGRAALALGGVRRFAAVDDTTYDRVRALDAAASRA
jgi:ABC-type phosphate/phosphonate transport system substrate-binding protein